MRQVSALSIVHAVRESSIRANFELGHDVIHAFRHALTHEESPVGKDVLHQLIQNAEIAREDRIPICQDTGVAVIFAEIGQEVSVVGGNFKSALEEGIRQGYKEGHLRKSLCHPFTRKNTGDNTPIIVHVDMVPGDTLRIWVVPKGGGSENMSQLFMLPPSAGWPGVKAKVVNTIRW